MTANAVGIVCALAAEARPLGRITRRDGTSGSLADGTQVAVSGMGSAAAALGARALIEAGVTALASWGVAGGLDPTFAAGSIFLPSEVVALDGAAIATASAWRERLIAAIAAQQSMARSGGRVNIATAAQSPVVRGRLLTSPRAIGSVAQKAELFRTTGAAAVDMESLAVAEVAAAHGLPFIAVRVIIDGAGDVLPRAVTAAADGAGHLQLWRLLGALALAPADLPPLIRLARRYRAANRSLAAVARAGSSTQHAFLLAPQNGMS